MANKFLIWNVYRYNINRSKIEVFNIFDHGSFSESVRVSLKRYKDKEEFAKSLNLDLRYYFWSKSEYEVLIAPWISKNKDSETIKIDIYEQVMNNWDKFLDYVWESKQRKPKKVEYVSDSKDTNKTGVWIYNYFGNGTNRCSICNRGVAARDEYGHEQNFNVCPYCGAEMIDTVEDPIF